MSKNYLKFKNNLPTLPNSHLEPMIELISNREATIEGIDGIVEYTDNLISINCRCYIFNLQGFNLSIRSNSKDSITVSGCITDIKFASK